MEQISIEHLSKARWDTLTSSFLDLSYQQCGSYAEAAARDVGAKTEFIGIVKANELIGLVSVRIKKAPLVALGIAYVNCAPLTANQDAEAMERFGDCIDALQREYVERRHLLLRIVPALRGGLFQQPQAAYLERYGFTTTKNHKSRETIVLDLFKPLSEVRSAFDAKWRNHLSKAERSQIKVTQSIEAVDFDRFECLFLDLARKKNFEARQDVAFFRNVQENLPAVQKLVLHLAWHDGDLVAGHVGSFVGETAVYLLGAANSKGRDVRASYLLQWAVIEHAKSVGNSFYDLGGIDEENNPDVYSFKRGLNGRRVREIGPYELSPDRLTQRAVLLLESLHRAVSARKDFVLRLSRRTT